jgi:hypothetical protein
MPKSPLMPWFGDEILSRLPSFTPVNPVQELAFQK